MKKIWLAAIVILAALSMSGCSFFERLGDQTKHEWSIDQNGLKTLIEETTQGMSEGDRLLMTIDQVIFSKSGGLTVSGKCQLVDSSAQASTYRVALITQDSKVRMEISVGDTCGIQQQDPRVAVMNDRLSNALGEKIAADCGKVLVDSIQLSGNRLSVWYIKPR